MGDWVSGIEKFGEWGIGNWRVGEFNFNGTGMGLFLMGYFKLNYYFHDFLEDSLDQH